MKWNSDGRISGIDALRVLAILSVLTFHAPDGIHDFPSELFSFTSFGWVGVDLFFVLSGFPIGKQLFCSFENDGRYLQSLGIFWIKRMFRTFPLYFFALFVYAWVKPNLFGYPFVGWDWRYLVFLQNFLPIKDFVQSWSLALEEQFYLFFPLVFLTLAPFFKGRRITFSFLWLIPLVISVISRAGIPISSDSENDPVLLWATHLHLDGISIGVFLAGIEPWWSSLSKQASRSIGIGGMALLASLFWIIGSNRLTSNISYVVYTVILSIGFGMLLISLSRQSFPTGAKRFFSIFADLSYGSYIWFGLVIRLIDKIAPLLPHWTLSVALFFAITFLVSKITYHLIELPFLSVRALLLDKISSSARKG